MIQERADSGQREQWIPILVFAGSWKGSRHLHRIAFPLLGWHSAVGSKGHKRRLRCLTCFSREKCCSLRLAGWFAVREFHSLRVQLPKALAPAEFNLCLGTVDRQVPEGYPERRRRARVCGDHPASRRGRKVSTRMWMWCRSYGAGRGSHGSGLAQVAAKPHQLHAGLGERGWTMNICKKASLKVKEEWDSRMGAGDLPSEGVLIWGFCFIWRALILWWETDKGTARFPIGAVHMEQVVSPSSPAAGLSRLGPCCPPMERRGFKVRAGAVLALNWDVTGL